MAWENRGNRRYYYRKRRIGGLVVSQYVGSGIIAELLAHEDQVERAKQEAEREAWNETKREVQELDLELDQVEGLIRALTRATLLDAGYHPHKGQWRKKRE